MPKVSVSLDWSKTDKHRYLHSLNTQKAREWLPVGTGLASRSCTYIQPPLTRASYLYIEKCGSAILNRDVSRDAMVVALWDLKPKWIIANLRTF